METWQIILGLIALALLIIIAVKLLTKVIRASKIRSLHSKISALDLRSVSNKAKRELEWTDHRTNVAVEKYRRFLFLLGKYEGQMLAPFDDDTDKIWHYHIQDTRRYKKDCEVLFGRFIDHNPDLTSASQERAEQRTRKLSRHEYSGDGGYVFIYDSNPSFIPIFQEHTPSVAYAEVSSDSWGVGNASIATESGSSGGWFGGGDSVSESSGSGWGGGGSSESSGGGSSESSGGGSSDSGGGGSSDGGGCGGGGCGGS